MKRFSKFVLPLLLALIACTLLFSACSEGEPQQTTPTDNGEPNTPHVHEWGEWQTVKDATCTEKGEEERSCECGEKEIQSIDVLGHTEVIDSALSPTCSVTGLAEGKHCSVCAEVIVAQEIVDTLEHTEGDWIIDKEATVKEDGVRHQVCSVCGATIKEEIIPATYSLGLAYSVNSDGTTCTITGIGTCTDIEIYIPEYIDGYKVTEIGQGAFANIPNYTSHNFTNVVLPNSVTIIGDFAFGECSGLTNITLSKNITSIGKMAFVGCINLESIDLPDSLIQIGDNAFQACRNLISIIIPDSVTSIGPSAFAQCINLKSITIPHSVTTIGASAFAYCTNLTSLTIGNGIKNISGGTFNRCKNLMSIVISNNVTSIGNCAFLLDDTMDDGKNHLIKVFYIGSSDEWNEITMESGNFQLESATRYYYSETEPTDEGNYWHYVDGVPTVWSE